MNKAKPFLLGILTGAATLFLALQYHVIRSHDGFQLVPRTPQHSVGLAYADIRNWEAEDWLDRPELARALFAHGSSDLISESVTASLADSVTSDNATLDQLRQLLDDGPALSTGDFLSVPDSEAPGTEQSGDEMFAIPFPTAARKPETDPFRIADADERESTRPSASGQRTPSRGDSTLSAPYRSEDAGRRSVTERNQSTPSTTGRSATQRDAAAVEELIFGRDDDSGTGSARQNPTGDTWTNASPFEDVTSELENRARTALQRAQSSLEESAQESATDAANAADRFIRGGLESGASAVFGSGTTDTSRQLQNEAANQFRSNFDPFIQ